MSKRFGSILVSLVLVIAIAIFALLACYGIGRADVAVGNGGNGKLPAQYRTMSTTGLYSIPNAKIFLGVSNLNTSTQLNAVTCYDNASAASGPVVLNAIVGLIPPTYPVEGVYLLNGLTCNLGLSLLGAGIAIYYR